MTANNIVTLFKASNLTWEGFGLNCEVDDIATISNQTAGLDCQWVRIFLEIEDPGEDGIYYNDENFDEIWENSENIQNQKTRFTFSTFQTMGTKFIFTLKTAPKSWLSKNNELRGDALVAFARLFVSAIFIHKKLNMSVEWVELCDEPSTFEGTFITPENYVILVTSFKSILQTRMHESNLKIMGPGLSCMIPKFQANEPYISVFINNQNLLDAWSIHVLENETDASIYNTGNFDARTYVLNQLTQTIRLMNWTLPNLPVFVSKFATNATRYCNGIDYGQGASETVEYAMRLIDNICGILNSGASSALTWYMTYRNDKKALYRNDGSKRPQKDALALLNTILPINGQIYMPDDKTIGEPEDQTLKAFIIEKNSFGFILSRPHKIDDLQGNLKLKIENANLPVLDNLQCILTLYAFPSYVSLSGVEKSATIENGIMNLTFSELPYNCIIYGKGDIYIMPPLLTPPIQKIQTFVPKINNVTNLVANERDIIYDVQRKTFAIYSNGQFVPCQIYKY